MRIILHSDLNNCYASIESIAHPEYKKIPIAVGGDPEKRHGIILAKNEIAKRYGVKTGEPLWQAQLKCPSLKILPPDFPLYEKYCSLAKRIYDVAYDVQSRVGMGISHEEIVTFYSVLERLHNNLDNFIKESEIQE